MMFAGPVGERIKIVNGRAAVMVGYPTGAARSMSTQGHPYFPKLGHHWPKSYWRRLMTWAFLWSRKRRAKTARSGWEPNESEEWAGVLQHFPAMVRRNNTDYIYTRNNIPIHPECTRQIYYHWSKASSWVGRLWENVQWNVFHCWMHYTNFSQQDLKAVKNQNYTSVEYFSPNDTPLVAWRKLCTLSRDGKRAKALANGAQPSGNGAGG